jgi:hypothetical protein
MTYASILVAYTLARDLSNQTDTKLLDGANGGRHGDRPPADRGGAGVLVMISYAASANPTRGLRESVPQSKTV